jgi:hypothetical protein
MTWVESVAYRLIDPFVVGTIAIFDVKLPSVALSVDTSGCARPCCHRAR